MADWLSGTVIALHARGLGFESRVNHYFYFLCELRTSAMHQFFVHVNKLMIKFFKN